MDELHFVICLFATYLQIINIAHTNVLLQKVNAPFPVHFPHHLFHVFEAHWSTCQSCR